MDTPISNTDDWNEVNRITDEHIDELFGDPPKAGNAFGVKLKYYDFIPKDTIALVKAGEKVQVTREVDGKSFEYTVKEPGMAVLKGVSVPDVVPENGDQANTESKRELAPKPHPSNTEQLDQILIDLMGLEYLESDENGNGGWGLYDTDMETGCKYLIETYSDDRAEAKAKIEALLATHTAEAVRLARLDELERLDTHYWNDDDADVIVDMYVSQYVKNREAQLKSQQPTNEDDKR